MEDKPIRAILIRVGADGTDGGGNWLAPADAATGQFVYIPIPEEPVSFFPQCERRFDEVNLPLLRFLKERQTPATYWETRIRAKHGQPMHLDPDFEHLTYGDFGAARGRDLKTFGSGDFIVFYSAFKPIHPVDELLYAMVGLMVIDEIVPAKAVEDHRRHENAHTRKLERSVEDIVVRARPGVSGRCERCIPIGEKRGLSNYYLRPDVEAAWGGLVKVDGSPRKSSWLNMSGVPPLLGDPVGFIRWWELQGVGLTQRNFLP